MKLFVVVPCYNEQEVLPETLKRMTALFDELILGDKISNESRIVFVDDGSRDNTWKLISTYCKNEKYINGIKLAKNAGHQKALLAGLMTVKDEADCVVSIDADLQDDISVIKEFIDKFNEGNDIVYGVRSERKTDSFFKRSTAIFFYKLMQSMGVNIVFNHADYRLMSKRALNHLSEFKEANLFLRGLVPLIGFKTTSVYYKRSERFAGESKYPLSKMLSFAFDGITSFSVKPIRLISMIGGLSALIAVGIAIYSIIQKFHGNVVPGWTSLMVSLWFLGGIQLIALGLIGEYIGKIYNEVKGRPRFIIEEYVKK